MKALIDVSPCRYVAGRLELPGDKSISHRATLLAIMADGPLVVLGCSPAADVAASLAVAHAFGVLCDSNPLVDGTSLTAERRGSQELTLYPPKAGAAAERRLDVGNSGTTLRIGLGICTAIDGTTYLDGDESIKRRPMLRVVEPLRRMGAEIDGRDGGERTPLVVRGRELSGATHALPVASAQVKSALILAGLRASGETVIAEPAPSRDHTERMLTSLGVPIDISIKRLVVKSARISGGTIDVPADISAAAAFMAAAAILEGSDLVLPGVGINPTRTGFLDILRGFGADVRVDDVVDVSGEPRGTIRVRAGDRRPMDVGGELALRGIDELPLVAVLGAFAPGRTTVTGARELRVKETDRIAATVAGLRAIGVAIEATDDGFVVHGGPKPAGDCRVDPMGDHRLAMAFAVAALGAAGPVRVADPGCVRVSHPSFFEDLASVAVP